MMILHTQHSIKRLAQRAIPSEVVSLAFHYGDCVELPGGVSRIFYQKKSIDMLKHENLITSQQAKKLKSAYLVVAGDGKLITAGYLTKAAKRSNWKYT